MGVNAGRGPCLSKEKKRRRINIKCRYLNIITLNLLHVVTETEHVKI